jgi:hypothetical protein
MCIDASTAPRVCLDAGLKLQLACTTGARPGDRTGPKFITWTYAYTDECITSAETWANMTTGEREDWFRIESDRSNRDGNQSRLPSRSYRCSSDDRRNSPITAVKYRCSERSAKKLHTLPSVRSVAQLEASISDLNLILRHRAAGNGTAFYGSWPARRM